MKNRTRIGIIILLLLFVLSACGMNTEKETEATKKKKKEITQEATAEESSIPPEVTEAVPTQPTAAPETTKESVPETKQEETETPSAVETTASKIRKALKVEPRADLSDHTFKAYDEKDFTGEAVDFLRYSGKISKSDPEDVYSFKAPETGVYRLEVSDLVSGFTITMTLYDAGGYRLERAYGATNGEGITFSLTEGETYKVTLSAYSGSGKYQFFIGQQKKTADISGYTCIRDKTEYLDQEINYRYIPEETGLYYFWVSDVKNGIYITLTVDDEDGYRLDRNYGLGKNEGMPVTLEAGKVYLFQVTEYGDSLGDFTVNIGIQKATQDISSYKTLTDVIQFEKQEINYEFRSEKAGAYCFEIDEVRSGFSVTIAVIDCDGYQIEKNYGLTQGEKMTVTLEENTLYTVKLIQYSDTGLFTVKIGRQRETLNISGYDDIIDCMEFEDQSILYRFKPEKTGTYVFGLSEDNDDTCVTVVITDKGGYEIEYSYYMMPGETMKAELKDDQTYTIEISEAGYFGPYTLLIDSE